MANKWSYSDERISKKSIGIKFKNKDLLTEALTHRSYLNEYPKWHLPHNERLEYLGDAVLELLVSEELFTKFPKQPEGQLTVFCAQRSSIIRSSRRWRKGLACRILF